MIRVTVELVSARTGRTSTLATAMIANDGKTSLETGGKRGSYNVIFNLKRKFGWRSVRVEDYPRKSLNIWHLVHRALTAALKPA